MSYFASKVLIAHLLCLAITTYCAKANGQDSPGPASRSLIVSLAECLREKDDAGLVLDKDAVKKLLPSIADKQVRSSVTALVESELEAGDWDSLLSAVGLDGHRCFVGSFSIPYTNTGHPIGTSFTVASPIVSEDDLPVGCLLADDVIVTGRAQNDNFAKMHLSTCYYQPVSWDSSDIRYVVFSGAYERDMSESDKENVRKLRANFGEADSAGAVLEEVIEMYSSASSPGVTLADRAVSLTYNILAVRSTDIATSRLAWIEHVGKTVESHMEIWSDPLVSSAYRSVGTSGNRWGPFLLWLSGASRGGVSKYHVANLLRGLSMLDASSDKHELYRSAVEKIIKYAYLAYGHSAGANVEDKPAVRIFRPLIFLSSVPERNVAAICRSALLEVTSHLFQESVSENGLSSKQSVALMNGMINRGGDPLVLSRLAEEAMTHGFDPRVSLSLSEKALERAFNADEKARSYRVATELYLKSGDLDSARRYSLGILLLGNSHVGPGDYAILSSVLEKSDMYFEANVSAKTALGLLNEGSPSRQLVQEQREKTVSLFRKKALSLIESSVNVPANSGAIP